MNTKKRVMINLICNIASFIIQLVINFAISSILVEKVGDAAYGFVGLSTNFISYATIFTAALNSMAGRFVSYEVNKGNVESANKYYSSVFFANILISGIIFIISLILIINIESIIKIPTDLVGDVKITFFLSFVNLILSLITVVFNIGAFVKNRIDLISIRNIIGNVIRAIVLTICFSFLTPKIYYIPFSSVLMSIFLVISYYKISKKICPELFINRKNINKSYIKKLISSGIWNSINSLSRTLLTGLDLLIANLFIGPAEMGVLSLAKTIPTTIENFLSTFSTTFNPQFLILYSENKIEELIEYVNYSLKVVGLIMLVPISMITVFGIDFFHLWLPYKTTEELMKLQTLSVLSLLPFMVSSSNYTLFVLDSVTNKLKKPVLATFIMSVLSTITTLALLKYTNLEIYAIAGVSSLYWLLKVFFFNTINAANNLNVKWNTFFKPFLRNLVVFFVLTLFYSVLKHFITLSSWKIFFIVSFVIIMIGYILAFILILNRKERKEMKEKIINKLKQTN